MTKNLKEHIERVHLRCHRYFKNTKSRHDYIDSIKCSTCEETFFAGNHYIKHYQTNHGGLPPEYQVWQYWLSSLHGRDTKLTYSKEITLFCE